MRIVICLYYLFYILSGGFRHFGMDFLFFNSISGNFVEEVPFVIVFFETALVAYSFCILIFPLSKMNHLVFGFVLLGLDLVFQNKVSFISSFILPHVFPFFFYFLLKFRNNKELLDKTVYISILLVATGYLTSCYSKIHTGWYNWNDLVVYGYILEFNKGFDIPTILGQTALKINSQLFWKCIDWSVIVFQFSYVIVFFKRKAFYPLTLFSIVFHVGILVALGIGVFYIYVLFYVMIYACSIEQSTRKEYFNTRSIRIAVHVTAGLLFMLYLYSKLNPQFFNHLLPYLAFRNIEYVYNLVCLILFACIYYFWRQIEKSKTV